jgi:hypothetical protein
MWQTAVCGSLCPSHGNFQPCNSVTSQMTWIFLISTHSCSHTFIQLLMIGMCDFSWDLWETSCSKLHPLPTGRELISQKGWVYGVALMMKQVMWDWGSDAGFTEGRCCEVLYVSRDKNIGNLSHDMASLPIIPCTMASLPIIPHSSEQVTFSYSTMKARDTQWHSWLMHCSTSWKVAVNVLTEFR